LGSAEARDEKIGDTNETNTAETNGRQPSRDKARDTIPSHNRIRLLKRTGRAV
jgi:hypothetical protein